MAFTHTAKHIVTRATEVQGAYDELEDAISAAEPIASDSEIGNPPVWIIHATEVREVA